MPQDHAAPSGYTDGSTPPSPVSTDELAKLEVSVLFTADDQEALRMAGEVLKDQVDDVLDVWYGFLASQRHLVAYSRPPTARSWRTTWHGFAADPPVDHGHLSPAPDEEWLSYAHEIGLRHTEAEKNQTDRADSVLLIPLRYMVAFNYPITPTVRPLLEGKLSRQQR